MKNQLTGIQSQIESFFHTNPEPEAVYTLIERLKKYEPERQQVYNQAEWENELPLCFDENRIERELFRQIYNRLKVQGITLKYSPSLSNHRHEFWELEKTKTGHLGKLMWFRSGKFRDSQWEMHGFMLVDDYGKLLKEFDFLSYY
jgi:hypothetical protein